jgi:hypothetical protein
MVFFLSSQRKRPAWSLSYEPLTGNFHNFHLHVSAAPSSHPPLTFGNSFLYLTLMHPVDMRILFVRSHGTGGDAVLKLRHADESGRWVVLDLPRSTSSGCTGVPRSQENESPADPTVGLPRIEGVS